MSTESIIQGKYVIGSKSVVGDPRRKWEDRVYVGEISRAGGESLIVGIVADGVGSADFGARGAQLAIDVVVEYMKTSQDADIPSLIENAITQANTAVYNDNQKNDGDGLTTLVVAVVYKERCYVGNVGDSRAYWAQISSKGKPGRVLQLTRDHTYYNIYGGDEHSQEAGIVVNAIGKKAKVDVDCGFYLRKSETEPFDLEKAYQLGLAGLPLQPGDSIVLCSDGLIKDSPEGNPYTKPEEILDALQSEYLPERAAIKLVSQAEGRRPDDNVSVVTIQYLSRQLINEMQARSDQAKIRGVLLRGGVAALALIALGVIYMLGSRVVTLSNQPTATPIFITNTPIPSPTITPTIAPGQASVHEVNGGSANVLVGQALSPGTSLFANEAGIRIAVGEESGKAGIMYWFPGSAGVLDFDAFMMRPKLDNGALYIQPGSGSAEVHFSQDEIVASVSGSRMIVSVKGNEITVYCFEGKCRLDVGLDGKTIPVGSFISYNTLTQQWNPLSGASTMTYDQMWEWNIGCNKCIQSLATPTPTITPTSTVGSVSMPTKTKTKEESDKPPTVPPTAPPPTVPPTAPPPTVPPTDPPPTVPPTDPPPPTVPPTDPPPPTVPSYP